ncbi:hypothetical protein HanRHA438_Chr16g0754811 [Helianthus annuus]|nr:hypothetical protein HanPI659440_Chr16g0633941 [Helianthus annuus]KAJ0835406.1 hypothetical protein HanRHA438_Chr16g0754811 [Helianthus annuus]
MMNENGQNMDTGSCVLVGLYCGDGGDKVELVYNGIRVNQYIYVILWI